MDIKPRPAGDPFLYLGMLRAVVIYNKVDIHFIGNPLVNLLQEDEKFLMPMPLFASCQHLAGSYIERSEQDCPTMTNIIMMTPLI